MEVVKVTDEYFNNCRGILTRNSQLMGSMVRYKVFAREDGIIVGCNKAVAFIAENTVGPLKIWALKDGRQFKAGEPVLMIEGLAVELVNLETTYLGFLSYSGGATAMKEIVDAAEGTPVIDMSARHFPWQIIEEAALAAYFGGAEGTSTRAGYEYVQRFYNPGDAFKLYASLPHAMAAIVAFTAEKEGLFPSVMAAKLFHEAYPEKPITVLVDYEGRELDVAKQAFEVFGDKLFAVRLDTHGGRKHQGTKPELGNEAAAYIESKTGDSVIWFSKVNADKIGKAPEKIASYLIGRGVTVEATYVMRDFLDSIGANNVKIVVSSGFTAEKVATFRMAKAPMDFIGTGSWIKFMMFTSDICAVKENGEWVERTKVGRAHGNGDHLRLQYERA